MQQEYKDHEFCAWCYNFITSEGVCRWECSIKSNPGWCTKTKMDFLLWLKSNGYKIVKTDQSRCDYGHVKDECGLDCASECPYVKGGE